MYVKDFTDQISIYDEEIGCGCWKDIILKIRKVKDDS